MSITPITTDQLRRIQDHDGLILQGCGGSLQEWQDGINGLLAEIGILKNGSRFILSGTTLGSTGIWCAWPIGWTVATAISLRFYKKGAWRKAAGDCKT